MSTPESRRCFLLTTQYRDVGRHLELTLFAKSEDGAAVKVIIDGFRPLFFVPHDTPATFTGPCLERKELALKSMGHSSVDCLYFATLRDCQDTAQRLRGQSVPVFESDVHPVERFLMEREVRGGFEATGVCGKGSGGVTFRNPKVRGTEVDAGLSVMSIDIETNAGSGEIYSIACSGATDAVFVIGGEHDARDIRFLRDEAAVLRAFLSHVASEDPDVLIGWSVVDFDLSVIQKRCTALGVTFGLGRDGRARVLPPQENRRGGATARVPGRVVLDVPAMLRSQFHTFERYSLDYVASSMLGRGKLVSKTGAEKIEEINRLFRDDKMSLARYNLEDARLTREIFDKAEILPNAVERSKRSGHLLDRMGGSVAAFDFLYLPALHRAGYVARDVADTGELGQGLSGGHVMDSKPGIHENVLLLDFRSLYPSLIMTFLIDPLGLVSQSGNRIQGPVGPSFARDESLLPGIIAELMGARAEAKKTCNAPLSQAIKILMNSFYGVLGTPGCRFFSPDLASTITGTGQFILKETVAHIEATMGHEVIYGDTDSLFVLLGKGKEREAKEIGERIISEVNTWISGEMVSRFKADSVLELEFETHFRYFFMPTIRGGTQGSKKRYCGAVEGPDGSLKLAFKGLESARTDWTELAREFQAELYLRIFEGRPVEDLVLNTVASVRKGEADDKLVYRKRLNKPVNEYTGAIPPHVQAARLQDSPGHAVSYVITTHGPQPVEKATAPLDHEHYIQTQVQPIADAILEWIDLSFEKITSGQQELFG